MGGESLLMPVWRSVGEVGSQAMWSAKCGWIAHG